MRTASAGARYPRQQDSQAPAVVDNSGNLRQMAPAESFLHRSDGVQELSGLLANTDKRVPYGDGL
jgi:hypothetical protein